MAGDHEQAWQPFPVDPDSAECTDHTTGSFGIIFSCVKKSRTLVYTSLYMPPQHAIIVDTLPQISTCPLHTNSGYGKERRIALVVQLVTSKPSDVGT